MKNFYKALMIKFNPVGGHVIGEDGSNLLTEEGEQIISEENTTANNFNISIGGRLFNTYAPENTEYPYAVFSHVAGTPDDKFKSKHDDILIQFSIFSTNPSSAEVHDCMGYLQDLLDDCDFPITGGTLVYFARGSEGLENDDINATPEGLTKCWHYHVDYSAYVQWT